MFVLGLLHAARPSLSWQKLERRRRLHLGQRRPRSSGRGCVVALRPPPGDPIAKKYAELDSDPYGPARIRNEPQMEKNQFGIEQPVLKPLEQFQVSIFGELREPVEEQDFTYRWERDSDEDWPVCPRGLYPENYPLSDVLKAELDMPTVEEYDYDERVYHIVELEPSILDMLQEDGLLRVRDKRAPSDATGTKSKRGQRGIRAPVEGTEPARASKAGRRRRERDDSEALFDDVEDVAFGDDVSIHELPDVDPDEPTLLEDESLVDGDLEIDDMIDEGDLDVDSEYDDTAFEDDTTDYDADEVLDDDSDDYRLDSLNEDVDVDFDYDGGFGSRATGPIGLSDDFDYD
jgi:hypothetical protein